MSKVEAYPRQWDHTPGMTLRDYIAAKMGASMIVTATGMGTVSAELRKEAFNQVAQLSYELADAMLEARDV